MQFIEKDGMFVGYLSSRETMARLGEMRGEDPVLARSGGAMRASGWDRIPLVRMTNVNLEPGKWTFDDLVADTDDGIYMEMNRSWSIDDKRLNFQFGTELAYEIKNGKQGRMLKNATYTLPDLGEVLLMDGAYEHQYGEGASMVNTVNVIGLALGNLDGDGNDDAAVIHQLVA